MLNLCSLEVAQIKFTNKQNKRDTCDHVPSMSTVSIMLQIRTKKARKEKQKEKLENKVEGLSFPTILVICLWLVHILIHLVKSTVKPHLSSDLTFTCAHNTTSHTIAVAVAPRQSTKVLSGIFWEQIMLITIQCRNNSSCIGQFYALAPLASPILHTSPTYSPDFFRGALTTILNLIIRLKTNLFHTLQHSSNNTPPGDHTPLFHANKPAEILKIRKFGSG